MLTNRVRTRFAPSPTGMLHLGNVRTAIFNYLYVKSFSSGSFLLRIEDTDLERSKDKYILSLEEDLSWLGVLWDCGEINSTAAKNNFKNHKQEILLQNLQNKKQDYRQSQRKDIYEKYYQKLLEKGYLYKCFCTPKELELKRKLLNARGLPPKYDGTCRNISDKLQQKKIDRPFTLRFNIKKFSTDFAIGTLEVKDLIKGTQKYKLEDLGDFIVKKSDGSATFFFSNAIDDALMGVTLVLRGEDHLTNTPRQIMLNQALKLSTPRYGHFNLIKGNDNKPLSKRNGSLSITEIREKGILPLALLNYLARLGHTYLTDNRLLNMQELAKEFRLDRCSPSASQFNFEQLEYWQKRAILNLPLTEFENLIAPIVKKLVPEHMWHDFARLMQENIVYPKQSIMWVKRLFQIINFRHGKQQLLKPQDAKLLQQVPSIFFEHAAPLLGQNKISYQDFIASLSKNTGLKGKNLFQPIRLALTGTLQGAKLEDIYNLLSLDLLRSKLS